jgi:hypothetical protein
MAGLGWLFGPRFGCCTQIRRIEIIFPGNSEQRKKRIAPRIGERRSHTMWRGGFSDWTNRPVRMAGRAQGRAVARRPFRSRVPAAWSDRPISPTRTKRQSTIACSRWRPRPRSRSLRIPSMPSRRRHGIRRARCCRNRACLRATARPSWSGADRPAWTKRCGHDGQHKSVASMPTAAWRRRLPAKIFHQPNVS